MGHRVRNEPAGLDLPRHPRTYREDLGIEKELRIATHARKLTHAFTAEARQRWERFLARDHERIAPLGRTILLLHGTRRKHATVLLHGLSASPTQFVRFAKDLHARGHNVIVPRLPHHGRLDRISSVQSRLTAEELRETVCECIAIACDAGGCVTVAGLAGC